MDIAHYLDCVLVLLIRTRAPVCEQTLVLGLVLNSCGKSMACTRLIFTVRPISGQRVIVLVVKDLLVNCVFQCTAVGLLLSGYAPLPLSVKTQAERPASRRT